MSVPYDMFTGAFLSKISEYELLELQAESNTASVIIDSYMKRVVSEFRKLCKYDFSACDDSAREFLVDVPDDDLDEIVNIVSEGMLVQWMKPYLYRQELLENALSTRDYTVFSPAELQRRVRETYVGVQKDFTQMIREYSYNHGDLSTLHI